MSSSIIPRFGNAGEYSRTLRVSWLATFWDQRIESGLDIDLKDILANADEFRNQTIEWIGAWRLGVRILPMLPVYVQLGFGRNVIDYWGLAGGISVPLANDAGKITVLYQYNLKTEGDWASAHTIYLLMNIGKHRKEAETISKQRPQQQRFISEPSRSSAELDSLRKIEGITIEQDSNAVKITAAEVAVHFKSGSSNLPEEALKALGEIAKFLKTYPDHSVSIEGHTDSDPITGQLKSIYPDNKALSKARAEKVKEYFVVTEKLPEQLFTTVGWGESKPLVSNDTKEGKSKNRRVVIIVKTQ
jgi:flagellar motor protein MotB